MRIPRVPLPAKFQNHENIKPAWKFFSGIPVGYCYLKAGDPPDRTQWTKITPILFPKTRISKTTNHRTPTFCGLLCTMYGALIFNR